MDNLNGYPGGQAAYPPSAIINQAGNNSSIKGPSLATAATSAEYLLKQLNDASGRLVRVNAALGGPVPTAEGQGTAKSAPSGGVHQLHDMLSYAQATAQTIHNEISRLEQLVGIG